MLVFQTDNSGDSVPLECASERRGRRLVFTHCAVIQVSWHRPGRVGKHRMTYRQCLPHTLFMWRHAEAWCDLLTRERESAPKQQTTNHISKKATFFLQQVNWPVCISVYLYHSVVVVSGLWALEQRGNKWEKKRILIYLIGFKKNKEKTVINNIS